MNLSWHHSFVVYLSLQCEFTQLYGIQMMDALKLHGMTCRYQSNPRTRSQSCSSWFMVTTNSKMSTTWVDVKRLKGQRAGYWWYCQDHLRTWLWTKKWDMLLTSGYSSHRYRQPAESNSRPTDAVKSNIERRSGTSRSSRQKRYLKPRLKFTTWR